MEQILNSELCTRCKGRGWCGRPCVILESIKEHLPKRKTHFSGSSPPEIFVGRAGYPQVNVGILSPEQYGTTQEYSMPELWHAKKLTIKEVLAYRGQLIYSRFKSRIKQASINRNRFLNIMQEISMADRSVSSEFFLKKPVKMSMNIDKHIPLIGNPAPLKYVRLEENPHIQKKVDYLVSDTDSKAANSMQELYTSNIPTSNIIKILSAGLLGLKKNRKLVPTRWAVTATDDTLSKNLLEKIRYYQEINQILLFHSEYVGNHYEFLLMPDKFAFEVIEAKIPGSVWNPSLTADIYFAQDYENFYGRKKYAFNVTGAYYSNRLALCEYLEKTKRQASCLVMRECRPEYWAPLGTGILREASRQAFKNKPERFSTLQEAFKEMQKRMLLSIEEFKQKSKLLREYKQQTKLSRWFKNK